MSSILDALRRIEREEGGNPNVSSSPLDPGDPGTRSRSRRIRTGAAVAALTCTVAMALWLSGREITKEERAEQPPSSEGTEATQVAAVGGEEGSRPEDGHAVLQASPGEAASPPKAGTPPEKTDASGADIGPVAREPEGSPPVGVGRGADSEPTTRPVTDDQRGAPLPDATLVGGKRAQTEQVPSSPRQPGGRQPAETDGSADQGPPAPLPGAGSSAQPAPEAAGRAPAEVPAVTSAKGPAGSVGDSGFRETLAAELAERMKTAESAAPPLEQARPVAKDTARELPPSEVRASEPATVPSSPVPLEEAKLRLPDSDDRSGNIARPEAGTKREKQPNDSQDNILRHRPPGAPYVRVSFLFYSSEPTRRRVMVTVNDGSLVTLFEGQSTDDLEVERILRDEVHFRYQGKVFAVRPRT